MRGWEMLRGTAQGCMERAWTAGARTMSSRTLERAEKSSTRGAARVRSAICATLVALGMTVASAQSADAQLAIPSPVDTPTLDVELERPFPENASGLAFYSSIIRVTSRFPVGDRATLAIEFPLSIVDGDGDRVASMSVGNVRADLLLGDEEGRLRGFLGFTGLTATDLQDGFSSQIFGMLAALDRIEDWPHDVLSLHGGLIPTLLRTESAAVGGRAGLASVWIEDSEDVDVWARAGAWVRVTGASARFDAEVGGAYLFGEGEGLSSRSVVYLDAALTWHDRGGSPGVFLRLPLDDDARDVLNASVGLRISVGG